MSPAAFLDEQDTKYIPLDLYYGFSDYACGYVKFKLTDEAFFAILVLGVN